jgi:hypothetical protein
VGVLREEWEWAVLPSENTDRLLVEGLVVFRLRGLR